MNRELFFDMWMPRQAQGALRARVVPVAVLLLMAAMSSARAQAPDATAINWWEEDSAKVAFLHANGQAHDRASVTLWAPVDSLDATWVSAFADSLAGGVSGLAKLIGGPHRWQRIGSDPVRYYFSPGRFVSHSDGGGGVFISLTRVRQRDAPYLHEAAHELLVPDPPFYPFEYSDSVAGERAAAHFPYWLSEGLPDYLAQRTAAETGFPEGDIFSIGGLTKADSVCSARVSGSRYRDEILARVGRSGRLEALFTTDRGEVAPVYYACSQSFTAHLVASIGLETVISLFPGIPDGTWLAILEGAAGEPLEGLRRAWMEDVIP